MIFELRPPWISAPSEGVSVVKQSFYLYLTLPMVAQVDFTTMHCFRSCEAANQRIL